MAVSNLKDFIWLGITVNDTNNDAHRDDNPFTFFDGTPVNKTNIAFEWKPSQPDYMFPDTNKCAYVKMRTGLVEIGSCNTIGKPLCRIDCSGKDESSTNSESDRSRANLPVFALNLAGSTFIVFMRKSDL